MDKVYEVFLVIEVYLVIEIEYKSCDELGLSYIFGIYYFTFSFSLRLLIYLINSKLNSTSQYI